MTKPELCWFPHWCFVIPVHFDEAPECPTLHYSIRLNQHSPVPPGSVILIGSSACSSSFSGKILFCRAISRTVRPVFALSFAISAARSYPLFCARLVTIAIESSTHSRQ